MKRIKYFLSRINKESFSRYFLFSCALLGVFLMLTRGDLTQARYETDTNARILPNIAFFVVGVESQTKQIKLESMVPSTTPYQYVFHVSNFNDSKKANVDLKYSIEVITTTNMPLRYKVFKGTNAGNENLDSDEFTTDENGVYYRHLKIDGVSMMSYKQRVTEDYTLWVEFPIEYKDYPVEYAGIIDLVDIKINAEQVV